MGVGLASVTVVTVSLPPAVVAVVGVAVVRVVVVRVAPGTDETTCDYSGLDCFLVS